VQASTHHTHAPRLSTNSFNLALTFFLTKIHFKILSCCPPPRIQGNLSQHFFLFIHPHIQHEPPSESVGFPSEVCIKPHVWLNPSFLKKVTTFCNNLFQKNPPLLFPVLDLIPSSITKHPRVLLPHSAPEASLVPPRGCRLPRSLPPIPT